MLDERFWRTDPETRQKMQEERVNMMLSYFLLEQIRDKQLLADDEFVKAAELLIESCQYPLAPFLIEGRLTEFKYDRERKSVSPGNGEHLQTQ